MLPFCGKPCVIGRSRGSLGSGSLTFRPPRPGRQRTPNLQHRERATLCAETRGGRGGRCEIFGETTPPTNENDLFADASNPPLEDLADSLRGRLSVVQPIVLVVLIDMIDQSPKASVTIESERRLQVFVLP